MLDYFLRQSASLQSARTFNIILRTKVFDRGATRADLCHKWIYPRKSSVMPPKRKRSAAAAEVDTEPILPPKAARRGRGKVDTNPDHNSDIIDSKTALRASPDADEPGEAFQVEKAAIAPAKNKKTPTKSSVAAKKGSDEIKAFRAEQAAKKAAEAALIKKEDNDEGTSRLDLDEDGEAPAEDADAVRREANRPPPVNSEYLPLPWKGRLGYVSTRILAAATTLIPSGLLKYVSATVYTTSILIENVPHSLNTRTQTSFAGPITT